MEFWGEMSPEVNYEFKLVFTTTTTFRSSYEVKVWAMEMVFIITINDIRQKFSGN